MVPVKVPTAWEAPSYVAVTDEALTTGATPEDVVGVVAGGQGLGVGHGDLGGARGGGVLAGGGVPAAESGRPPPGPPGPPPKPPPNRPPQRRRSRWP